MGGPLKGRRIDVRFISATNVDIEAAVKKGTFRGDLMYRLNTLSLSIPPLRERKEEIPALVATFLAQMSREVGRSEAMTLSDDAMACLLGYLWPGNIRELKNVIERAVVLCDGPQIVPEHLPLDKLSPVTSEFITIRHTEGRAGAKAVRGIDAPEAIAERQRILEALEECGHNQTRAAARLGMSRRTLSSRLDLYGIRRPQKHEPSIEDDGLAAPEVEQRLVNQTERLEEPPSQE